VVVCFVHNVLDALLGLDGLLLLGGDALVVTIYVCQKKKKKKVLARKVHEHCQLAPPFNKALLSFSFSFLRGNTEELGQTSGSDKQVDGEERVVLGDDDERVSGPDQAGGGQGDVLRQGQVLGRAGQITDTGTDKCLE